MKPIKFKNPLDTLFNIESDHENELTENEDSSENQLAPTPEAVSEKDEDDVATDAKFDEIYTQAIGTFQNQMAYTEIIEPRYAARNAEVAASYLNIALQAAATKAKVKTDRKRANSGINAANKVTNNTIVCTREEIMKLISVDADTKEIK
jgi:hypothetical protein